MLGAVRWEQVALVFVTLAFAVAVLRAGLGGAGSAVALLIACVGIAGATWRMGGRTLQQWLPVFAKFIVAGLWGSRRGVSRGSHVAAESQRALSPFKALEVMTLHTPRGDVGVVVDRSHRTLSAVVRLRGAPFALLDDAARQRIVDAWSGVLAALAQQPGSIYRLSWIEQTIPDHALSLAGAATTVFAESADLALIDARRSYLSLLERESTAAFRHESLLVVTVRGTVNVHGELPVEIGESLSAVANRCAEAGLEVEGLVTPDGVRATLARTFVSSANLPRPAPVFPLATNEEWAALRTDGTWHATYWIAEWPRSDVANDFLLPFLLEAGFRRSVVVVMAPQAIGRAVKEAERARTEKAADVDLRRRHGFAQTAKSSREQDAVKQRESELAAGHGAFRFGGYVVVTAASKTELELDCARTEQAAARAHLALRRLYGAQREALFFGLPLGRGL